MFLSSVRLFTAIIAICTTCQLASSQIPISDLNEDFKVDIQDLAIFAQDWLENSQSIADIAKDNDNIVNFADFTILSKEWLTSKTIPVVINEIHYNPDLSYELVEFIELHNTSDQSIDIAGWFFSNGVSYIFPPDTQIAAYGYIVITEDSTARTTLPITSVQAKYNVNATKIFGPFVGSLNNEGEEIELRTANGDKVDQVDYSLGFPWPTVGDEIPTGSLGNGHSIQLINPALGNNLGGSWRSALPSPGSANNSVYTNNAPPQIRQVNHSPKQPTATETVTITAKATDPDGVNSITLSYQTVQPGIYIPRQFSNSALNPAYEANWNNIAMHDDGLDGDLLANDSIYTVQMPPATMANRNLIRYRIIATDTNSQSIQTPYSDDPQPNFAYFIYDGVPAWTGSARPGYTEPVTYDETVMDSIPVYHLISSKTDVENSTWYDQYRGSDYLWSGTLVYDGKVYDHIHYRARGGVWRYSMGKNMWKFDFNRGHYFQGRDDFGDEYKTKWDKLNFSACIQQGNFEHRGEQGMFEAAGFKLFNMMGCEAPKTHWLQFRIIDDANENGTTQYNGDLWGLYLAIEQMDGKFLAEHNLPDGNLYKIEGYNGDLNNQGSIAPINGSDYSAFKSAWYNSQIDLPAYWWSANVDRRRYYNYRCVVEGIHHGDIAYGKNYFFYHNSTNNQWTMYPWDLDLTWANNMYGNGQDPFINGSHGNIFSIELFQIEYNNRLREFHDLLYNDDQLYQLLDEMASIIDDPDGGPSMVDVDRAMWDYHPVMIDYSLVHSSKAGHGRFYQKASTKDFPGMIQIMKDYVTGYRSFNSYSEDPLIPDTPVVTYIGTEGFPENDLTFQTNAFSDPQGGETFAAMKWRIAEVEQQSTPPAQQDINLIEDNSQWKYFKGTTEPSAQWKTESFDDDSWLTGNAPIGYGENFIATALDDMRGSYTTFYCRREFTINDPADIETLELNVLYDDGFNLWINGNHVASANVPGNDLPYDAMASAANSPERFIPFTISNPEAILNAGDNVVTIQILNGLFSGSSDCFMDMNLTANLKEDTPTAQPTSNSKKENKYEINPLMESGDTIVFASDITVPANGIKPGKSYRIRCKMKDTSGRWSHWSDPLQFIAGDAIQTDIHKYLRITELMYNNGGADFIELQNISSDITIDLSDTFISDGISFNFGGSDITSLAPGAFILVVKDLDDFHDQYGSSLDDLIAGEYSSSLSNSGETIKIEDLWNGTLIEFEYNDSRSWPLAADGAGHSLVPLEAALEDQPSSTLNYGPNWRPSYYIGGSPGNAEPAAPDQTVLINEFMAHTDYFVSPHESNDWIELYNTATTTVSIDGNWYLSDDSDDLKKFALPVASLTSQSYISYDQVSGFNPDGTGDLGWGLNKAGDTIYLSYLPGNSDDRIIDCIQFKGQPNAITLGRYPDGGKYFFSMTPSRDTANLTPNSHIIISEIMYHPQDDSETTVYNEYIELYNPTSNAINMSNTTGSWAIDGGVDYTFPASLTLASADRIIIVGFDPTDTAKLDAFQSAYNTEPLTAGGNIFGPYAGNLSNDGARITLEAPQDSDDPDNPLDISWIIIDECCYNDYWPWPTTPDGSGDSLHRTITAPGTSGLNASNWQPIEPSPLR